MSPSLAQIQTQFSRYTQPLCSCGKEVETIFLLSCLNYSDERLTLLSKIRNISPSILENTNSRITRFFLYGEKNVTASTNFIILSSTIEYMLATKKFDEPLFHYISYNIYILIISDLGTSFY